MSSIVLRGKMPMRVQLIEMILAGRYSILGGLYRGIVSVRADAWR
jgi:hypothetical protein